MAKALSQCLELPFRSQGKGLRLGSKYQSAKLSPELSFQNKKKIM
jgi:hypothetical protein